MNLLTINSYDCSAQGAGGVNQVTVALNTYFTHHCGINCYMGYFHPLTSEFEPLPEIKGRIQLNRHLDEQAFRAFLLQNKIDIVQVNYLRKENIYVMRDIYRVAHECGAKVIHAFHMAPAFQVGVYASWDKVWYSIRHHERIGENVKFWLFNVLKPVITPFVNNYLNPTYKMQWESCDKLVTLSPQYIQPFMEIAGIDDPSKFTSICNELRFNRYPTPEELQNKEKTVLVLQRLSEDTKRISLSIRTWSRIEKSGLFPDWKMQVVGDGMDAAYLRDLAQRLRLKQIEFTGHQNPYEYAKKASIFVLASATEGWPMVMAEALQMGCPAVAMNAYGAVYDVIQEGYNGHIVESGDLDAYYNAIVDLMRNDKKRQEMARNAIESSKQYEVSHIVKKWLALFNEIQSA